MAIATIVGVASCTPDNNGPKIVWSTSGTPVGEWCLIEWNSSKELPFGVYLRLNEDHTFDLYQHTYSVLWVHYSGTYTLDGTTLCGQYSDGVSWGNEYKIEYSKEPNLIRLTSSNSSGDVGVYAASDIPDEIEENANSVANIRSVEMDRFL